MCGALSETMCACSHVPLVCISLAGHHCRILAASWTRHAACTVVRCYSASHPSEWTIQISHVLFSFHLLKLMVSQKLTVLLFHDVDLPT